MSASCRLHRVHEGRVALRFGAWFAMATHVPGHRWSSAYAWSAPTGDSQYPEALTSCERCAWVVQHLSACAPRCPSATLLLAVNGRREKHTAGEITIWP